MLEWVWEQVVHVPESSSAAAARSAIWTTFWLSPWWASSFARVSTAPRECSSLHSFSGEVGRMWGHWAYYPPVHKDREQAVVMYWSLSLLIVYIVYSGMVFTAFHSAISAFNITMKVRPLSWMHAGVFSLVTRLDYWLGPGNKAKVISVATNLLHHSPFWLATLSRHPQATHFGLSPPSPASREDHCLATSTIRGHPPLSNTWKRLSSAVENEHTYKLILKCTKRVKVLIQFSQADIMTVINSC